MADVYERLGPSAGTAAEATLYTVGPGEVRLIVRVRVVNTTTSEQTFKMSIGADAAGTRIYSDTPVPAGGFLSEWLDIPIRDGETLRWNGPTTLTVIVTLRKPT